MLKVWSEFKFSSCSEELKTLIRKQRYDLYLLISPEPGQIKYAFKREDPSLRNYFFNAFKKEFDERRINYTVLNGDFYLRKKKAVEVLLKKTNL